MKFYRQLFNFFGFIPDHYVGTTLVCPFLAEKASVYLLNCNPINSVNSESSNKSHPPEHISNFFNELLKKHPWNNKEFKNYPVLPALYVCEDTEVDKIASTGFALIHTKNEYFGEGHYFTTSPKRIIPMLQNFRSPVILICFTFPGNPLFITSPPALKKNWAGVRVPQGSSHYAIVNEEGHPIDNINELIKNSNDAESLLSNSEDKEPLVGSMAQFPPNSKQNYNYQDELVLSENAEIVPLFLLKVNNRESTEIIENSRE